MTSFRPYARALPREEEDPPTSANFDKKPGTSSTAPGSLVSVPCVLKALLMLCPGREANLNMHFYWTQQLIYVSWSTESWGSSIAELKWQHLWPGSSSCGPVRLEVIAVPIQKLSLIAELNQWSCQVAEPSQVPHLNLEQRQQPSHLDNPKVSQGYYYLAHPEL